MFLRRGMSKLVWLWAGAALVSWCLAAVAMESPERLLNGSFEQGGAAEAPAGWSSSNDAAHAPEVLVTRSPSRAWSFQGEGAIFQEVLLDVYPGERIKVSGYLLTPGSDRLRNGARAGSIELSFYAGNALVTNYPALPAIDTNTPPDIWIPSSVEAVMPSNATKVRVTVRCNGGSGAGRFLADDVSLTNCTCLQNLLTNGSLTHASGAEPAGWLSWNSAFGPETNIFLTGPNAWTVWDEGGIYQDITSGFAVGDQLAFGYWALQPSSQPFEGNPASQMRILFYNESGGTIEANWAMPYLMATNKGSSWSYRTNLDEWVFSHNISRVPSNTVRVRIEIRQHSFEYGSGRFIADNAFLANLCHESNLLVNPLMNGTGTAPDGWEAWSDGSHDPAADSWRSGHSSWTFWWDGGVFQDVGTGWEPGYPLTFGAWLMTPAADALRNGSKRGVVELEFYGGSSRLSVVAASNAVDSGSAQGSWIRCAGGAVVPHGTTSARLVIRCDNASSGDGRFFADDAFVVSGGPGTRSFGGSVYTYGGYGSHGVPPPHDKTPTNFLAMDVQAHTTGDGRILHLWGCNWKWMRICEGLSDQYPITPDTVLEFDFLSDGEPAEVNGVGFAGHASGDITTFAPEVFFQVYGTETFSNQVYRDYPGSGWRHYEIPVGQYTTNAFYAFVIANEADAGQDTSVYYRNLRLVENHWARAMVRDSDGDGSSDWQEGIAGTDPASATSRWDAAVGGAGAVGPVLRWASMSNRTYTVYRSVGSITNFVPIAQDVPATPPWNAYTDTVSGIERALYRIRARK